MSPNPPKATRIRQVLKRPEQIIAERCRRSLFYFMQEMWDTVSTDTPVWNWHIPYLCAELAKEANRVAEMLPCERDIIINIPPGTTKSMTCSIMFPVWCWTNWHWMRFITGSYSAALSLELAEYSREIIRSRKFQTLFPELVIKRDKDTKTNFKIQKRVFDEQGREIDRLIGGNRFSASVGSTITGFHGHFLIVDDPIDPTQAVSEVGLHTANQWVGQTLSTRKINKEVTSTILIMQRLSRDDPTGHLLDNPNKKIHHICLPGEVRSYADLVSPQFLLEHYKDDLLDPKRMPWHVLEGMEANLGPYGFAGQVNQHPTTRTGGMFKADKFKIIEGFDRSKITNSIRYWDKAGTEGGGCFSAGVLIHRMEDQTFVVEDVVQGQWAAPERERRIKQCAIIDKINVVVWVEQEPGSGGKESAENTIRNLAGFCIYADKVTGAKPVRAEPYAIQVENGNVYVLNREWTRNFINTHVNFPESKAKDVVDAASGAMNKLLEDERPSIRVIE